MKKKLLFLASPLLAAAPISVVSASVSSTDNQKSTQDTKYEFYKTQAQKIKEYGDKLITKFSEEKTAFLINKLIELYNAELTKLESSEARNKGIYDLINHHDIILEIFNSLNKYENLGLGSLSSLNKGNTPEHSSPKDPDKFKRLEAEIKATLEKAKTTEGLDTHFGVLGEYKNDRLIIHDEKDLDIDKINLLMSYSLHNATKTYTDKLFNLYYEQLELNRKTTEKALDDNKLLQDRTKELGDANVKNETLKARIERGNKI